MTDLLMAFREGGASMYAVLALDLCSGIFVPLALIFTLVARFTNKYRTGALVLAWLAVLSALVPMCAGVSGYYLGMYQVEAAVVNADPSMRDVLLAAGEAEASNNLSFGFGSGCCLLVPAVLALMLVPPKREPYEDM